MFNSPRLRENGRVILTVASTGIAAHRLPGGWTARSMFKRPSVSFVQLLLVY